MAGRPPLTRRCLSWTAEGALGSAVRPELTREREVGGSALHSDQSQQPPAHIGPSQPGARPTGAAYSPELTGGPGPGRVSVPSFLREAVAPHHVLPARGGAQPCSVQGTAGSPDLAASSRGQEAPAALATA